MRGPRKKKKKERGMWTGNQEDPRVPSLMTKAVSVTKHAGPARGNWEELETDCGHWEQLGLPWEKERAVARRVQGPETAPFSF